MHNKQVVSLIVSSFFIASAVGAQNRSDPIRDLQTQAIKNGRADWGYWGTNSGAYYDWCNHSNRLVPVYSFGIDFSSVKGANSVYRSAASLKRLYTDVPA